MGFLEDILKGREEMIISALKVLEGRKASVKVDLDGVQFEISRGIRARLSGQVRITVLPEKHRKRPASG
jgi:hypothetical protein